MNRPQQPVSEGRRARRMASTRNELLLAGRRLFSEKGLYESRIEEITESADVGKGTLYGYFRNREALILAVVEAGFHELRRQVGGRTARAADLDQVIGAITEAHVRFFADNRDLLRIFHQARGMLKFDRAEWRPLRGSLDEHLRFLAAELRRFGIGARLGPARRRELAVLLFGGVSGILSVSVAADPATDIASMSPLLVAAARGMVRTVAGSNGGRLTKLTSPVPRGRAAGRGRRES